METFYSKKLTHIYRKGRQTVKAVSDILIFREGRDDRTVTFCEGVPVLIACKNGSPQGFYLSKGRNVDEFVRLGWLPVDFEKFLDRSSNVTT
jgi:hypothetical protein